MRTDTPNHPPEKLQPPKYKVADVHLDIRIFAGKTLVKTTTHFTKNHDGAEPLVLNGERLKLVSVAINGRRYNQLRWTIKPDHSTSRE